MLLFYVIALMIGCVFLIYGLRNYTLIAKYKKSILQKDSHEVAISSTREMLEQNNSVLYYLRSFDQNIVLKIFGVVGVVICVWGIDRIFSLSISKNTFILIGIFSLIFFILAPSKIIGFIMESKIRKIGADIPIFVDLLAICVQSGMSIQASIAFLEDSISQVNPTFAPFLSRLISKIEVSGLEVALMDLQEELPSKEISMMCQTLKQSLRYGSQVYDSLMGLSAQIRESNLLESEEAIGKLSAKMSVPLILFFMFPVIIVIAAPGVIRVLGGFL